MDIEICGAGDSHAAALIVINIASSVLNFAIASIENNLAGLELNYGKEKILIMSILSLSQVKHIADVQVDASKRETILSWQAGAGDLETGTREKGLSKFLELDTLQKYPRVDPVNSKIFHL